MGGFIPTRGVVQGPKRPPEEEADAGFPPMTGKPARGAVVRGHDPNLGTGTVSGPPRMPPEAVPSGGPSVAPSTSTSPGMTINLNATSDAQLEAIRKKQADYTEQLQTNTTKAANVGRLSRADALESQKAAAKQAALAAGRPWTAADEMDWADRKTRFQQQAENEMLIGREATIGASIGAELNPVTANISQQATQKAQQLEAARVGESATQSRANLEAEQSYRQALLKVQQQQLALQQAQQLQSQMYGPAGPGGAAAFGGAGVPAGTGGIRVPGGSMSGGGGRDYAAGAFGPVGHAAADPRSTGRVSGGAY